MHKYVRVLVSISCVVLATSSYAALTGSVDHGSYLTDTTSGLDWLDATATLGQSYDSIQAELGSGGTLDGWQFATTAQFGALLQDSRGVTTASTRRLTGATQYDPIPLTETTPR